MSSDLSGSGMREDSSDLSNTLYTVDKTTFFAIRKPKHCLIIKGTTTARSLRISYPGAYSHITSQGSEDKAIFRRQSDREKFLSDLESATQGHGAVNHVYGLMTNHHLLMDTPSGNLRYRNQAGALP